MRAMMKRLSQAIGLLIMGLLLGGCGGGDANEIRIGHYGSLTGPEATFGRSTDQGIKLAIDEINAAGGLNGKKLRLITYDDQGKADEAGSAVIRLITRDRATAVLGEVASSLSLAAAPVCQKYKVPMITPSSTNPEVTKVGDMIYRVCFIDPFQGYVCAKFAREHEKTKAKKVAVLYDTSGAYSVGLAEEFEKHFKALGGAICSRQTYKKGDQDFTPQLTNIRESNPDMIFVPGYYADVANIVVQARKAGIKVPFFGGDGWDSTSLVENAGEAIYGCFFSNHYSQEDASPAVREFIAKYQKAYNGQVPDGLAALGYDAMKLLFAAMQRADSLKGPDLAKAIAATKDLPCVTGTISIDGARNAVKPGVMLENVKGVWKYVATIEPPE